MGGGRASRKDDGRGTGRKRREKGKEGRKEGRRAGRRRRRDEAERNTAREFNKVVILVLLMLLLILGITTAADSAPLVHCAAQHTILRMYAITMSADVWKPVEINALYLLCHAKKAGMQLTENLCIRVCSVHNNECSGTPAAAGGPGHHSAPSTLSWVRFWGRKQRTAAPWRLFVWKYVTH